MFYHIEVAIWTHFDSLVITVPICEDVAADAVDLGVILRDRAVWVHSEYLTCDLIPKLTRLKKWTGRDLNPRPLRKKISG